MDGLGQGMDAFGWTVFWIIACVAIAQSLLMALQTWEHHRYVRSCLHGLERYQPSGRVLLCAPCKGLDLNVEDNLRAILEQDYADYEVAFIVESADDPVCPAIRRAMAAHSWMSARLIVAGRSTESGQKIHNLRAATERISSRIEYIAFIDSDAQPKPEWLRMLLSRLDRPNVGAATGYRWFVPEQDSLANHILYGLNCGLMSLLGRSSHSLVWGGSWAVRRELFDRLGLHSAWKGTVSDDFVASRLLAKSNYEVRFIPACVVASPIRHSFFEALSFSRRQYLISRIYARNWWLFALAATTFSNTVWFGGLGMIGCGLLGRASWTWIPVAMMALLYFISVYRGSINQKLLDLYFPHLRRALRRSKRFDIWFQPIISLVHGIVLWGSAFGRNVNWRGVHYQLSSDGKIRRVWRDMDRELLPMPGLAADRHGFSRKMAG